MPTGAQAPAESGSPTALAVTAPNTSPPSWKNAGIRNTSHHCSSTGQRSPYAASQPSASSSRHPARHKVTLPTSSASTLPEAGSTATNTLLQWLKNGQDAFTTALHHLAEELDRATDPTNYQRRREVLRDWSLPSETWNEIITRLPPVPGPVSPNLDDRVRQEASAFVWAYVTCGEPLYAPRHIEAAQPPDTRQSWQQRRANTWFRLSRPHALNHYAALRGLLCQHGDALIEKIESGTSKPLR